MDNRNKLTKHKQGKLAGPPAESASDSPTSITERVSRSAIGLARDALLHPGAAVSTNTLASLAAGTEKGEPSSSLVGPAQSLSTSEPSSLPFSFAHSHANSTVTAPAEDGFRSHSSVSDIRAINAASYDFDAFLVSPNLPILDEPAAQASGEEYPSLTMQQHVNEHLKAHGSFKNAQQGPSSDAAMFSYEDSRQFSTKGLPTFEDHSPLAIIPNKFLGTSEATGKKNSEFPDDVIAKTNHQDDGAAVTALLSEPGLPVDDGANKGSYSAARISSKSDNLTPQEAKDQKPARARLEIVDPQLAFIPNFESSHYDPKATADAIPRAQELASVPELKPWLDILNTYQDEVWGDFLSLVQQAKEELETASPGEAALDNKPAVRRLRMLLGHLDCKNGF